MRGLPILAILAWIITSPTSSSPAPEDYITVTAVSILGVQRHAHPLGPGYVPIGLDQKQIRFAFSGEEWDQQCPGSVVSPTKNGNLVGIIDNCKSWQPDIVWSWDIKGRIMRVDGYCMELSEPETLVEAPELGRVNFVEFWNCAEEAKQQWAALQNTRKIANVAHPNLCLTPLEGTGKGLLAAVDCKDAKDIEMVVKPS